MLQWLSVQVGMSLACGSVAGLISSTATFPLDLVRRRLQLVGRGGPGRPRPSGGWGGGCSGTSSYQGVFREIWRQVSNPPLPRASPVACGRCAASRARLPGWPPQLWRDFLSGALCHVCSSR